MMKGIFVVLALVACAAALSVLDQEWQQFKIKFNKKYSNDEEENRRHEIFLQNKALIEEHNKKFENGEVTFTMGVNHLADLLLEETAYLRGYKYSPHRRNNAPIFTPKVGVSYPESIDWREKGYVTPVKNQGHCGSCWAFSGTGSLEGQNFAKTGTLVSLSEQNLVDCAPDADCNGGWISDVYWYVMRNGGIDTEESYPYIGKDGTCSYNASNIGGTCSDYNIIDYTEDDLLAATATIGPISASIDASQPSFQYYSSGVYYDPKCSSTSLDHAVLVVGYGTEDGEDYWLVKNSWGTDWGDNGYIQMARNKSNNCGIATDSSYPIV